MPRCKSNLRCSRHGYLHLSIRPSSGLRPPSPGEKGIVRRTPLLPPGEGGRRPDEGRLITARSCVRRTSSCVDTNELEGEALAAAVTATVPIAWL